MALLAGAILRRLPGDPAPLDPHARFGLALFAGLLFVAHPLQTQSVTYVVQRMNALAALFYLAALLAWWRGREAAGAARRVWWSAAGVAGVLALGSKEIAVTLPLAVWLCEWFFFRDLDAAFARRSALRAGLPLLAATLALYAAIFRDSGWGYAGRPFTPGERLLTELRVVVFYASLVLLPLPSRLNLLHDFPLSRSLLDPLTTLASAGALLALVATALALGRRAPLVAFAIAWFLLHLVVESALLPVALAYEHRTYLPLVGAAVVAPWAVFVASSRRAIRAVPIGLLAVALLGAATRQRNWVWDDELRFWSDTAAKSPHQPAARNNLGTAWMRAGHPLEAAAEHRAASELDPSDAEARNNLGHAQLVLGARDEAIARFREALLLDPGHFRARHNLGMALAEAGHLDDGVRELERALHGAPEQAPLWNSYGALLVRQERLAEAAEAFRRALLLDPGYSDAARNRAIVLGLLSDRGDPRAGED